MRPEVIVTEGLLSLAKMKAASLVDEHRNAVAQAAFRSYAVRKYHVKPQQVTFDERSRRLRRIRNASLSYSMESDLVGETELDEVGRIWISGTTPMSFERLVGTLLHESLHGWCKVRGKWMPVDREHACMKRLGDWSAKDEGTTLTIHNASADVTMTVSHHDIHSGEWQVYSIQPRGKSTEFYPLGTVRGACTHRSTLATLCVATKRAHPIHA